MSDVNINQDPAADGAAAKNKAITLELAKQIASIGGDPTVALQSGTFAPGTVSNSVLFSKLPLTWTDW